MSVFGKLGGTSSSSFKIGVGEAGHKTLEAGVSDSATPPAIRWNDDTHQWEFSNDGLNWTALGDSSEHDFNRAVLEVDGKTVYIGDGDIVLRSA